MKRLCDDCRATGLVPVIKRYKTQAWQIERDANGIPVRMLWLGEVERERQVGKQTCPTCNGKRVIEVTA